MTSRIAAVAAQRSYTSLRTSRTGAGMRPLAVILAILCVTPGAAALGSLALPLAVETRPAGSSAAQPSEGANATDPQGDAVEWTPEAAHGTAHDVACHAYGNGTIHRECDRASGQVPALDAAGTPAPPALDIVSLGFVEREDALIAELGVASLDEAHTGLVPDDSTGTAFYVWYPAPEAVDFYANEPERFVKLTFSAHGDPHAFIEGTCWECEWRIPFELEYGSPGYIRFTLPRHLLPQAEKGDVLETPMAYSLRFAGAPATSWRVFTDHTQQTGTVNPSAEQASDLVYSPGPFTFQLERAPFDLSQETDTWSVGKPQHTTRPDVPLPPTQVLRTLRIVDTPTRVGAALQIEEARLNGTTVRVDMIVGDAFFTMGIDGTSSPHVMRSRVAFADEGVADYNPGHPLEVMVTESPGPLGWINVTWARADLRSPSSGTVIGYTAARLGAFGDANVAGNTVGVTNRQLPSPTNTEANYAVYGPFDRYHLRVDTVPLTDQPVATFVKDALGDVALPALANAAGTEYKDRVDITFLEVKGVAPGESRVTLGIRDLSRVTVPAGYRAVAYAAAVDTANGPTMVVYYKMSEQDGGQQEFFCAPDNAVLAEARANPYDAVRMVIDGIVVGASPVGGGESDAIVFRVPHACLGADVGDQLAGSSIAAATFLVPQAGAPGTADVELLDEVRADEAVVLGAPAPPAAGAPWYDAPLGIREFWNILGVGLALVGGGVAVAARQHRRTVLQRELRAVDEIHGAQRARPAEWRKAMAERRAHAGELLQKRRLRSDEVLLIERRIELLAGELVEAPKALPALASGAVVLDRYRVERLLGEGGQARAFLAHDETLRRKVVVKSVPTLGLDQRSKRMVLAEARLLAAIDHPNVVRVHDVQEVAQDALLILEYVEGGSLRDLMLRRGSIPAGEAVAIARGVLRGLHAAHARGVVHRDVKPENVLLGKDGAPKLADFGMARDARASATFGGGSGGTLAYMSPEQVRGGLVDARSDVYSAAAVLVEMLTGAPYLPFGEVDEYQARALIVERVPELRLPQGALPLTGFLLRALSKRPEERYQTAEEALSALDGVA